MKDEIGNTIRARRKMLGISQQTLAELAGVGINTLASAEKGTGNPSIDSLSSILDVLGLELEIRQKQSRLNRQNCTGR